MRLYRYIKEVTAGEKYSKEMAAKYRGVPIEQIPTEDLWVAMMRGNTKLAKNIKTFNLPAGGSCPNMKECYKDCYAKKAEKMRPVVRISRERNFRLAKENTQLLKKRILQHLEKGDVVRIHESGDFFSQEYLDMWYEIAKERPDVMFYTYSKTEHLWDWSKIKRLPNFNLVSSIVGGKINFGPEEEIKIRAQELGVPICPCRKGNKVKCGIDCKICWTEPYVLFIKH
ncbi:MAG TPA: hypothetical protein P5293_01365 [Bacteroidales bacterium]|nr:hypothetical protein [Bacteroidales bacterium]